MHLTRRDLRVLEALFSRRAETLDDYLGPEIFSEVSRKRALNRLGELVTAGFLMRTALVLEEGGSERSLYSLTARGHTALERRSLVGSEVREKRRGREVPLGSLPHEFWTNRVRDILGPTAAAPHELPKQVFGSLEDRHRPDLVYRGVETDPRGRDEVWVEVDLGHYSARRILEKVEAFVNGRRAGGHQAGFLLFVCPTEARRERLRDIIARTRAWDCVDAACFEDLRGGGRLGYDDAAGYPLHDLRPAPAADPWDLR